MPVWQHDPAVCARTQLARHVHGAPDHCSQHSVHVGELHQATNTGSMGSTGSRRHQWLTASVLQHRHRQHRLCVGGGHKAPPRPSWCFRWHTSLAECSSSSSHYSVAQHFIKHGHARPVNITARALNLIFLNLRGIVAAALALNRLPALVAATPRPRSCCPAATTL